MTHSFNEAELKLLRSITGLKTGSTSTLISTLAKQICKKKLTVVQNEKYLLDYVNNHHE